MTGLRTLYRRDGMTRSSRIGLGLGVGMGVLLLTLASLLWTGMLGVPAVVLITGIWWMTRPPGTIRRGEAVMLRILTLVLGFFTVGLFIHPGLRLWALALAAALWFGLSDLPKTGGALGQDPWLSRQGKLNLLSVGVLLTQVLAPAGEAPAYNVVMAKGYEACPKNFSWDHRGETCEYQKPKGCRSKWTSWACDSWTTVTHDIWYGKCYDAAGRPNAKYYDPDIACADVDKAGRNRVGNFAEATGDTIANTWENTWQAPRPHVTPEQQIQQQHVDIAEDCISRQGGALVEQTIDGQKVYGCAITDNALYCVNVLKGTYNSGVCKDANGNVLQDAEQGNCVASGQYWRTDQRLCYANEATYLQTKVATDCIAQGKVLYAGSCIGRTETPEYNCEEVSGGHWAPEYEYCFLGGIQEYQQAKCYDNGKIWVDGRCTTLEQLNQEGCAALHGVWKDNNCWDNPRLYEEYKCFLQGKVYSEGRCESPNVAFGKDCTKTGGYWFEFECWSSKVYYDRYVCEVEDGGAWYNGACRDLIEVEALRCEASGGNWVEEEGCYRISDARRLCLLGQNVWFEDDKVCLVLEDGAIPAGLEKWYRAAQDEQIKAMGGFYQAQLDSLLAKIGLGKEERELIRNGYAEIEDFAEGLDEAAEQQLIDQAVADSIAESDPDAAQEALEEYQQREKDILLIEQLMTARIQRLEYPDGPEPDFLQDLLGLGGTEGTDVKVSFPKGIMTPKVVGTNYCAKVPTTVDLPAPEYEFVEVAYLADTLAYQFSANGGATWKEFSRDISDQEPGAATYNLEVCFAKTVRNPDLAFRAAVYYAEEYTYDGEAQAMDALVESIEITRTFYNDANPLTAEASAADTQAATSYEEEDAEEGQPTYDDGESAGGSGAWYNVYSDYAADAQAAADGVDQKFGLGLGTLVKFMPYIAGALLVVMIAAKGWLDWVPGVQKIRNRRKKDEFDIDLEDL